jgi:hypothetical protein
MAVKAWMFPPVVGYNTEVSHGAVKTLSAFNFANLAAKTFTQFMPKCGDIYIYIERERERERHPH